MFHKEKTLAAIFAAYKRISDIILRTPLIESKWLSEQIGSNIYLKLESEQITGCFKIRGATNKIKLLMEQSNNSLENNSLITASSGNHALACAHLSSQLAINFKIYSYLNMSKAKEEMLLRYKNVELFKYGDNVLAAEMYAKSEAKMNNLIYVSGYNDIDVIHGQATIAMELLNQKKDIDVVFVTVGGGSLSSGVALYLKLVNPNIKIIACQAANDCCMYESIQAGRIVEDNVMYDTIADGAAGRVELGSITFDIIQEYVDEWVLLTEEEIERAVYDMMVHQNKIIEGAAGCVVAGVRKMKEKFIDKNIALIICGGNLGVNNVHYLMKKYNK